jgi:hypothetical protein
MTSKPKDETLFYVGPGYVNGVPADDLSAHRLARIARVRKVTVNAIRSELLATGWYQEKPPSE